MHEWRECGYTGFLDLLLESLFGVKDMEKEIKSCYAVVAILDVLGTRQLDISGSLNFVKSIKILQRNAYNTFDGQFRAGQRIGIRPGAGDFLLLGDTFIAIFPISEDESQINKLSLLSTCVHYINEFFLMGLESNIFMRGAISLGDVVYDESTAVGPAVNDAIAWAEQADWFGVHLTPSCGMNFERVRNNNLTVFDGILYDVPLSSKSGSRSGGKKRLWCANWTKRFVGRLATILGGKQTEQELYTDRIRLIDIFTANGTFPLGTESKYTNTLDFFDYCCGTRRVVLNTPDIDQYRMVTQ
jgi:hypothetical protein